MEVLVYSFWLLIKVFCAVMILLLFWRIATGRWHPFSTKRRPKFTRARPFEIPRSKAKYSVRPNYDSLVKACMGDREVAARLMAYELKKRPGLSQEQAAAEAYERLRMDRS